ncbi:MAG: type I-B CRISPR-associated protein Cas8b1/Cst1 [Aggregatilineales bacterium]
MLNFTGHLFVDIGIAALCAFSGVSDPKLLRDEHLQAAADWLAERYTTPGPLQKHTRSLFFFNAGYYQKNPQIQHDFVARVLYSWRNPAQDQLDEPCVFCGRAAAYRATREEVPLLNGREVYNFSPKGRAGIPICGFCSLAMQALPLGCFKSGKFLIAVHSDERNIILDLAREACRAMQKALTLSTADDEAAVPNYPHEETRLAELLVSWVARIDRKGWRPASVTGCVFTNYGSDPSIRLFPLDAAVFAWLDEVLHHEDSSLPKAWERAVERGWKRGPKEDPNNRALQANEFYEALLKLPEDAEPFLKKRLLPVRHWGLVETYLRRIMGMRPEKIALLREVGARCAQYSLHRRRFLYEFSRENNYAAWRRAILRAADESASLYGRPLVTFDEFLELFTAGEGEYNDWRLARDLITLIMIEQRVIAGEIAEEEPEASFIDEEETQ